VAAARPASASSRGLLTQAKVAKAQKVLDMFWWLN